MLVAGPLFAGRWLRKLGIGLKGRGREDMVDNRDVDEIVRLYDGAENPIGNPTRANSSWRCWSRTFMCAPSISISFRRVPSACSIPAVLHRLLDRHLPFMIYASLEKKDAA